MTPAIRATLLICATLAAATITVWLGLGARPSHGAIHGADDPPAFWRESQAEPARQVRRYRRAAFVRVRVHRSHYSRRRPAIAAAARPVLAQRQPAHETPAAFRDRVVLPPQPAGLDALPALLLRERWDAPPVLPRPRDDDKRNGGGRRLACVAAALATAAFGALLSARLSQRSAA